jgi:hypothetical protein
MNLRLVSFGPALRIAFVLLIALLLLSPSPAQAPCADESPSKTDLQAAIFRSMKIEWISRNEAQARVEAFSDGIAANWNTLRIVFRAGSWAVKTGKLSGVS